MSVQIEKPSPLASEFSRLSDMSDVRIDVNNEVQMFSSAWFDEKGISGTTKLKIAMWIAVSLVLATIASILLATPVMAALGMTALLG